MSNPESNKYAKSSKSEKKDAIDKSEKKSILYHKDGILFIDIYKALDDEHILCFNDILIPKGVCITCRNCSKEITLYSELYKVYYCPSCLRLYPFRNFNLEDESEKEQVREWIEKIRPIIPSSKNKDNIKKEKIEPILTKEDLEKASDFEELKEIFK